jgi:hypothetical protein
MKMVQCGPRKPLLMTSNFGRWRPAPSLWYWFKKMQERALYNDIECTFAYDESGYQRFVEAIGPIPRRMKNPTVGRHDHSKGYVFDAGYDRWNFEWQERADNSRECADRIELQKAGNIASALSPKHNSRQIVCCPYCGREGRLTWPRLSEQSFRVDKWSLCRG